MDACHLALICACGNLAAFLFSTITVALSADSLLPGHIQLGLAVNYHAKGYMHHAMIPEGYVLGPGVE